MNELTLARALHVLSIIIWIGGVGFVTTVLLPTLKHSTSGEDKIAIFNEIENRFSLIAKVIVLIAGLSGFFMIQKLNAWHRFEDIQYFWMHAMVSIWILFVMALFIIEPFFLNHGRMIKNPHIQSNLRKTQIVHGIILTLSVLTAIVSVLGAHGFIFKIN